VLTRAVRKVCPTWMSDRRDDLIQAAMMKVMAIQQRSEGNRELTSSYLYRVAHSALIDEIRRLRRRREVDLDETASQVESRTSGDDPERSAASSEIGHGIQDCLTTMLQDRRLAVTLHLQGHSVPEAASILGWTAKRTENLVYRGLADLRKCLEGKGLRP
jgi:RNA polymerase sigma-70 factor (ECF subfamily)